MWIWRICFLFLEAIRTIPAIKDCDVESILAITGTTAVANSDTSIFTERAYHFATSGLYDLESFLVFIYFCHTDLLHNHFRMNGEIPIDYS